jgi:hypothetical protein
MVTLGAGGAAVASLPENWEPMPDDVLADLEPLADDDPAFVSWVSELLEAPPTVDDSSGPSGAQLSRIEQLDVATASDEMLATAIQTLDHMGNHVDGLRLAMIAALAGPEPTIASTFGGDWTPHEVAMAMRISLPAADRQVALARHLAGTLTQTMTALQAGRVSLRQTQALHEATVALSDDAARQVEARVLPRADEQDISGFRRSLRRAVAAVDPEWNDKAEQTRREPRIDLIRGDDGMSDLYVHADTETIAAIHAALHEYADRARTGLGGTAASRMVTGLLSWASGSTMSGTRQGGRGRATTVNVLVDLPTLLGLRDHPGEVIGYGPIPARAVRALLAEGAPLRRLVTDPLTGALLDYGRSTYVVPKPLARYLVAAHQHSRGPHSSVPAARCDLDHRDPWSQGGPTDRDNMTPLDRRWHRARTHAGYRYETGRDGVITWTSPHGLTAKSHPPDFRLGP